MNYSCQDEADYFAGVEAEQAEAEAEAEHEENKTKDLREIIKIIQGHEGGIIND